jgi:hypothetical protein
MTDPLVLVCRKAHPGSFQSPGTGLTPRAFHRSFTSFIAAFAICLSSCIDSRVVIEAQRQRPSTKPTSSPATPDALRLPPKDSEPDCTRLGTAPAAYSSGMIHTDHFTIHYDADFEDDGRRFHSYVATALVALCEEFRSYGSVALLSDVTLDVNLASSLPERTRRRITLYSHVDKGRYFARIELLTPSVAPSDWRSTTGEPHDDRYYLKNMVHECSSIFLDRLTRTKSSGWRYYSAPLWFTQGYEEYLALTRSSEHSRTVTLDKYKQMLRENPARVRDDWTVVNPYVDGSLLVLFLHEVFGRDRVHAILLSRQPSFDSALESELQLSSAELYARWQKWVQDTIINQIPSK